MSLSGNAVRRAGPLRGTVHPDVNTVARVFRAAVREHGQQKFLGEPIQFHSKVPLNPEPYKWETYEEVGRKVESLARSFRDLGFAPGTTIGLWSVNRAEWTMADYACSVSGCVSVPLYDTLGPDAVEYVINHAGVAAVVASPDHVETLLKVSATLKVIVMDGRLGEIPSGDRIIRLSSLLNNAGATIPDCVAPDDLCTIMYTSGTTGMPKGVMLTHRNVVAGATGIESRSPPNPVDQQVLISYLPTAHIYERIMELICAMRGQAVGYFSGDVKFLPNDIAALKPTILPGVPRLYLRIVEGINTQIQSASKVVQTLFQWAMEAKEESEKSGKPTPLWDRLVFSKIKAKMGGRVRMMSSGSAPMPPHAAYFLRRCFGTTFLEGYGLTETAAACTCAEADKDGNYYGDYGHVGTPLCCNEVRLEDVPDMNYLTTDKPYPRGEICVRGLNVFVGYYKEPEKTAEVLDKDGWFHTGDVGMWRDGKLVIIDRKKNIFKLSQGEYVRPEHIENVYAQSPWVKNVFVYGNSYQTYLVGVIVPDIEGMQKRGILKQWGLEDAKHEDIVKDERLRKAVAESIAELGAKAKLHGFEKVHKFHLDHREFSVENGLLTPSFKLKRNEASLFYKPILESLYTDSKL